MAAAPKKDDLKAKFEAAAAAAKQTRKKPDNATLLKLYSYYKQAWSKLKGMTRDEAMTQYVKQVDKLNRE